MSVKVDSVINRNMTLYHITIYILQNVKTQWKIEGVCSGHERKQCPKEFVIWFKKLA